MDIDDGGGACNFEPCFADQPAAVWAASNAHRIGLIIRYPPGAEQITGYFYEPWHLRYIGVEAAVDVSARSRSTSGLLPPDRPPAGEPNFVRQKSWSLAMRIVYQLVASSPGYPCSAGSGSRTRISPKKVGGEGSRRAPASAPARAGRGRCGGPGTPPPVAL